MEISKCVKYKCLFGRGCGAMLSNQVQWREIVRTGNPALEKGQN